MSEDVHESGEWFGELSRTVDNTLKRHRLDGARQRAVDYAERSEAALRKLVEAKYAEAEAVLRRERSEPTASELDWLKAQGILWEEKQ